MQSLILGLRFHTKDQLEICGSPFYAAWYSFAASRPLAILAESDAILHLER